MRILPLADAGLLVELDDLEHVHALYAALSRCRLPGVTNLVPAARTLLLQLDPRRADPDEIERLVRATPPDPGGVPAKELIRVPVVYDGADLGEVAEMTGLTEREVVTEHTGTDWTVAFGGFAPGFGYLAGGSPRLEVSRRAESRTSVPRGSVGLAGSFSGIYPRSSPGGWRLIGRTELEIWRTDRQPPALLRPGVRVRFEEVR